ncbi:MAG: hypothetical protein V1897_05305 [Pseudomonadota bacterium]
MEKASISKLINLSSKRNPLYRLALVVAVCAILCCIAGCGMINPGKWKGIETTSSDEQYYLLKDVFLSPGSAYTAKDSFDHNVHESVNLFFVPRNETNQYTAETVWFDPADQEFRKIRQTYDTKSETKKGINRDNKGTTRVHSMPTSQLFNHKPGLWKVELYLEGKLARRLTFSVR